MEFFGVTESVLCPTQSYLSDGVLCVVVGADTPEGKYLAFGVPQGSVLGPRKCCFYSVPDIGPDWTKEMLCDHRYSTIQSLINRLRLVQNCDARLVTGTRKRDHITPIFF